MSKHVTEYKLPSKLSASKMMRRNLNPLQPLPPIGSSTDILETRNLSGQSLRLSTQRSYVASERLLPTLASIEGSLASDLLTKIFSLTQPAYVKDVDSGSIPPADALTVDSLRRLEKGFKTHDEKGVRVGEFITMWRDKVSSNQNEMQLHQLFIKIDALSKDLITWQDFITYTWMEMNKVDLMKMVDDRPPYPRHLHAISNYRERESIIGIQAMQINISDMVEADRSVLTTTSRYLTLSRNGMLRVLNLSCELIDTFNLREFHNRSRFEVIATGLVYMKNIKMVAVSFAHSYCIHLYSVTSKAVMGYKLNRIHNIRRLPTAPMCLEYIVDSSNSNSSHLLWGDTDGNINVMSFSAAVTKGPFGEKTTIHPSVHRSLERVKHEKYPTARYTSFKRVHDDWTVQIRSCPLLSDCGFMSCSKSGKVSVFYGDLKKLEFSGSVAIKRGVTCLNYSEGIFSIYAGCMDGKVRVVKPFPRHGIITNVLHGHYRPITALAVDERRQLLISAAEDQRLVVHRVGQNIPVQTLDVSSLGLSASLGSFGNVHNVSCLHINELTSALLISTHLLGMFEHRETKDHTGKASSTTHEGICNQALYNPLFDIVVSCDIYSTLCLWKLSTGRKIIQFRDCHQVKAKVGTINQEIVTMTFDPSYRRLLTGAHDGSTRMWNVNNGMMIRHMDPRKDVTCSRKHGPMVGTADDVVAVLWSEENNRIATILSNSRTVYTYIDEEKNEECYALPALHQSAITCAARLPPTLIATCSGSGDIIVRSLINGKPLLMFNADMSTASVLAQRIANYKSPLKDKRIQAQSILKDDQKSKNAKYRRYSSLEKQAADPVQARDVHTYPHDTPTYKQMAMAAALGYDESTIQSRQSMEKLFPHQQIDGVEIHHNQAQTEDPSARSPDGAQLNTSIDCVLSLLNRINTKYTATLLTGGSDGWIRAWSTTFKGELLGQFNAAHHKYESIISMATDLNNEFLFTGDSEGYIKVWDIETYCLDEQQHKAITTTNEFIDEKMKKYSKFVLVENDMSELTRSATRRLRLRSLLAMRDLPPPASEPMRTLKAPTLLNSFRGHMHGVTSISYVDSQKLMVSSGADGNVRLWTLYGRYVGHFGQSTSWDISSILERSNKERLLPHDVKRVASSTTLMVWNGGTFRRWSRLRAVCLAAGLTSFLSTNFRNKPGRLPAVQKEDVKEKHEILLSERKDWASVASAIQLSVADYLRRNRGSALQLLNETDETLLWVAESLNPSPDNKELTQVIKSIWWKSLRFKLLKVKDDRALPTPLDSRPNLDTSLETHGSMQIVVDTPTVSQLSVYQQESETSPGHLLYAHQMAKKFKETKSGSLGLESPQLKVSPSESIDMTNVKLRTEPECLRKIHEWNRISVSARSRTGKLSKSRASSMISRGYEDTLPVASGVEELCSRVQASKYLGKSYKKLGRHKPLPKLKRVKMYDKMCIAFRSLPFVPMESFTAPPLPKKFQERLDAQKSFPATAGTVATARRKKAPTGQIRKRQPSPTRKCPTLT